MGKTYKDKANHFKHHLSHGEDDMYYAKRNKLKYKQEDIPEDIKNKVAELEYNHGSGDRYGNNRQMYAKMKVSDRRIERKKENTQFQKDLKNQ